jgi:4-amino-4-deoxy-L-arabinose transferase-like glycosyltransferase
LPLKAWAIFALAIIALFFLYFFGLGRTGLLGPDEPRYAAIGREMAQTGDWVTPRLNGQPWFEKPALLYWMTAAGFDAGLDEELAPRLPVAIVSVGFLVFFFFILRSQFGQKAAAIATCILATSAGWLAYSHIAVTDLPMSAAFASAMLVAIPSAAPGNRVLSKLLPIFLALAILAKGLVPLVLFLPAVWFLRRRSWIIAVAILIALPWYLAVGPEFAREFFWKHHFQRFATGALAHVRPFWFFVPVLAAGMFPWTPALALLFRREMYRDRRVQFLAAWFGFGFLFFSVSQNKLPGYLLPLLPAVAALCGIALAEARRARWVLAVCAVLLWLIPAVQEILPQALISGLSHTHLQLPYLFLIPILAIAALCWFLRPATAVAIIGFCVTLAVIRVVWITYPILDNEVSARPHVDSITCSSNPNRSWRYGLDYYAHRPIPDCK